MKKLFTEVPYIKGERLVLKRIERKDAPELKEMVDDKEVYRYLPTYLFEQKYEDINYVIDHLYDECFLESIIMGIYINTDSPGKREEFCGIAEFYGYREDMHKISVGYRFRKCFWGQGMATETLRLMIRYLYEETDTEIITASTMIENQASANVLKKNGFELVISGADEDWGYEELTPSDKWIR